MQAPFPSQHPRRPRRPRQITLAGALVAVALTALLIAPPAAVATTAAPHTTLDPRPLAATCANCHGTDGRPADPAMPPLAGLPQDFIEAQMRAFRSGERPATVMHQISRGYTDGQVEALARYFAGLPR